MKSFREIKKELKAEDIEVRPMWATVNGFKAYKVFGSPWHNTYALWTARQIKDAYYNGEF